MTGKEAKAGRIKLGLTLDDMLRQSIKTRRQFECFENEWIVDEDFVQYMAFEYIKRGVSSNVKT